MLGHLPLVSSKGQDIVNLLDRGFNKPIPTEFDLVYYRHSRIGVGIVCDGRELGAICGKCRRLLGWTFAGETDHREGYWSCLKGCKTIYKNHLAAQTSSVKPLGPIVGIESWLSGWLGVDEEKIEVEIGE